MLACPLSDLMSCLLFSVCKVYSERVTYDDLAGNLKLILPKHLRNVFVLTVLESHMCKP